MALVRHRETARIVLRAATKRFLLLLSHWSPESGLEPRWVSPGGGVEEGEDLSLSATRELFEETGLVVKPEDLGPKIAELEFRQQWLSGDHETGVAHFFELQVPSEFEVNKSLWTPDEHRDILAVRWWHAADLKKSGETVGPPGLLELLEELG